MEINIQLDHYNLNIKSNDGQLFIELDSKFEVDQWKAQFTQNYIQDLTKKTGNPVNFNEFVNILQNAANKEESYKVQIFTYSDLQKMKGKTDETQQKNNNKRYLIVQFKKAFYPLSLNLEELDDKEKLKEQIRRLKNEMQEIKSETKSIKSMTKDSFHKNGEFFLTENNGQLQSNSNLMQSSNSLSQTFDQVRMENELLKIKLKRLEESFSQKKGAIEIDAIVRQKFEIEQILQEQQEQMQKEKEKYLKQVQEKEKILAEKDKSLLELKDKIQGEGDQSIVIQSLKENMTRLYEQSSRELQETQKKLQKQQKDLEKSVTDIDFFKKEDRKNKNRIKQLEAELETTMRRTSSKGVTDRLYQNYRSPSSTSSQKRPNSLPNKNRVSPVGSRVSNTSSNKNYNYNRSQPKPVIKQPVKQTNIFQDRSKANFIDRNRQQIQQRKQQYNSRQNSQKTNSNSRPAYVANKPATQQNKGPVSKSPGVTPNYMKPKGPTSRSPGQANKFNPKVNNLYTYNRNVSTNSNHSKDNLIKKIENAKYPQQSKKPVGQKTIDQKISDLENLLSKAKK